MGQFTQMQTEAIKQHVLDCNVRRLTIAETQIYLRERGIDISFKTVKNYKRRVRDQAQNWIAKLARSKKSDYIAEYKARIDEVFAYQKRLWQIANNPATGPRTQVEAVGKLLDCTGQLIELYDCLPIVNSIRDYEIQDKEHPDISQES